MQKNLKVKAWVLNNAKRHHKVKAKFLLLKIRFRVSWIFNYSNIKYNKDISNNQK